VLSGAADTFALSTTPAANNVNYLGDIGAVDGTIQLDHKCVPWTWGLAGSTRPRAGGALVVLRDGALRVPNACAVWHCMNE